MSDLHDARVEEIAEVMADMNGEPRVGRYERTLAAVALKNADAVVTVDGLQERIEDTLAYYQCRETNPKADHPSMGYHAFSEEQREWLRAKKSEAAAEIVRMILAILRGGEERPSMWAKERPAYAEYAALALAAADAGVTVDAREHLHAKCDCVPDLGPAHCHLCGNERGAPVPWPECSAVAPVVTVEMIADRLARELDGNDGDDLGSAHGEGALHLALDFPIREAIEDVYADCGDSDPRVLSTNIAKRLAYLLPPAVLALLRGGDGSE